MGGGVVAADDRRGLVAEPLDGPDDGEGLEVSRGALHADVRGPQFLRVVVDHQSAPVQHQDPLEEVGALVDEVRRQHDEAGVLGLLLDRLLAGTEG